MIEAEEATRRFMAELSGQHARDARLSTLGAGVLAAAALDLAHDSRSFARSFGVAHALVLREVQGLADIGRITITSRHERTQRCSYRLEDGPRPSAARTSGHV